jgi:hypothetical protein
MVTHSWTDHALVLLHDFPHIGMPGVSQQLLNRVLAECLQAALIGGSFLTSKMLMTGALKDFPLSLLFAHVSILWSVQTQWSTRKTKTYALSSLLIGRDIGAFWFLVLVLTAYVCSISAYKVLRFAGSVPTASMLLSVHFSAGPYNRCSVSKSQEMLNVAARATVFAIGFAFVLIWDYRVNVTSRDMSVAFLISSHLLVRITAIAVAIQDRISVPWFLRTTYRPMKRRHWPLCVLPPLAIVAYLDEASQPFVGTISTGNCMILLVNLVLTTAACIVSCIAPTSDLLTPDSLASLDTSIHVDQGNRTILAFSGSVCLGSWLLLDSPAMLSSWQVVGYLTALVVARSPPTRWLVTEDRMSKDSALLGCRADVHQCAHSPGTDGTATRTSSAHQLCRQANQSNSRIVSVLVIWSIFACTILLKPAVLDYYRIDIGTSVTPSTDFDVVIAAYDRPGIEMAHDIDSIMSLQTLQNRTTSIYIYNKGPETSQFERNIRQNLRNASTLYIEGLDNKGKEGGTYLHHIVSQWDSLARHTLFIQEQPHDFALLKQRIADYLVPETGFMSLSYEGKTWKQCEHLRAGTWTGITESISRVSSMVNSSDTCQDPLLTFRGQFLVSDARIRSNSKTMYAVLLHGLVDDRSWMHAPALLRSPWVNAESDSVVDPVFGYTLERLWGVIMRCSNRHVADRSPSLLGSYMRSVWFGQKVAFEDVQCLDDDSKDL